MAAKGNKIFISYRREDAADISGRIRDWLVQTKRAARDDIFMDVTAILPGADFLQEIEKAISQCRAVVVVISPSWLNQVNNPDTSYVRLEAESALRQNIPVIPVLVGGAQMPPAERLPESLRPLTRRNARQVRADSFDYDMDWVRRGLGGGRNPLGSLSKGWVAAVSAVALVALGLGVLSQTPQGASIVQTLHGAAPTATWTPTPTITPTVNTGPTGQVVTIDDANPGISYVGTWTSLQGPTYAVYVDSTAHTTTEAGGAFSYTFKGTGVTFITTEGVDYGHTAIYIDGSLVTTLDLYASSQQNQVVVFNTTNLAYGTHTFSGDVVDGRLTVDALQINE
ncbi:MAG TPA: TIR domain-containing protein [Ktedonobacterales bacterium]